MHMMKTSLSLFALCVSSSLTLAQDQLIIGGGNFATVVGQSKGFYAEQNLSVTIAKTSNSDEVRDGIAKGSIHFANFGIDNALAMSDKNGADIVFLNGNENPPIQFVGNKGVEAIEQIRNRPVLVDAPNTQNAVIMKRILAKQGLEAERDYSLRKSGGQPLRLEEMKKDANAAGTMVSWPEYFQMQADGYKAFGSSLDVVGPMMIRGNWTMRPWANANRELVVRYLSAEVKSLRWAMDPKNRDEVIALLAKSRNYSQQVASIAYENFMTPSGWQKDGALSLSALTTTITLRAEVEGGWGGKPPAAASLVDLSFLAEALKRADAK